MLPTRIDGAMDKPIGAPDDWNPDQNGHCAALFVRCDQVDGIRYLRSAWETTPSEALSLLAGGKVELGLATRAHPVTSLGVSMPADGCNPAMSVRFLSEPNGTPYIRVEALYPSTPPVILYCEVRPKANGMSNAQGVAHAIEQIEELARSKGLIE